MMAAIQFIHSTYWRVYTTDVPNKAKWRLYHDVTPSSSADLCQVKMP